MQRPIIGPHPVEQTAYQSDIKDNGYKSVFTNCWLVRQSLYLIRKIFISKSQIFICEIIFYEFYLRRQYHHEQQGMESERQF